MKLKTIALCGQKGAGKDTFASVATKLYPNAVRMGLADKLKDVCSEVFKLDRSSFDDPARKERYIDSGYDYPVCIERQTAARIYDAYGIPPTEKLIAPHLHNFLYTPRQIAQYVGSEMLRSVDPDIHCKALAGNMPKEGIIIITDVRFFNEMRFFRKLKALFVGIDRPGLPTNDKHQSEASAGSLLDACDEILINNSTKESFEYLCESLLRYRIGDPK